MLSPIDNIDTDTITFRANKNESHFYMNYPKGKMAIGKSPCTGLFNSQYNQSRDMYLDVTERHIENVILMEQKAIDYLKTKGATGENKGTTYQEDRLRVKVKLDRYGDTQYFDPSGIQIPKPDDLRGKDVSVVLKPFCWKGPLGHGFCIDACQVKIHESSLAPPICLLDVIVNNQH